MTVQVGVATARRRGVLPQGPGARLYRRTGRWLALTMPGAAVDGAAVIFFYLAWVLPSGTAAAGRSHWEWVNLIAFLVYLAGTFVVASLWCHRVLARSMHWLVEGRDPTPAEQRLVMRVPLTEAVINGTMWAGAALLFPLINLQFSGRWAADIAISLTLAGLSNVALTYLIAERVMRPVFAVTLTRAVPERTRLPGVACRMQLAWFFCSGVPILGIGLAFVGRRGTELSSMAGPTYFLVAVALVSGVVGTYLTTRSVSDPIAGVKEAMARVEAGDTSAAVSVYDASEIGALQAGFNRMVAGLQERRRLQDLFGRHVGEEVARRAFERGAQMGGEVLEVGVLFVDIRHSTELASREEPATVVAVLNRFFATVVDVVSRNGGWVNKFEGDGALCVFGAPEPRPDAAGAALRAARELADALRRVAGVEAGIGVSAGPVVAGNVGAESRYEYTVIGTPVNEAARLTELAKTRPERVATSESALHRADPEEAGRWTVTESARLRGQRGPTWIAAPAREAVAVRR